jgi:hypothetical protein
MSNHVPKNTYTVIGFYRDNNQPWMEHVTAPDPKAAAGKALVKLSAASSGDPVAVEVIAGHHNGKLCNETLMALQDGVLGEVGES